MHISDFVGQTFSSITVNENKEDVLFICEDGDRYKMLHHQDCCESVLLEDVQGDLSDLLNHPITLAEKRTNSDNPKTDWAESFTWTFYVLATIKGYVTIRWYGESNGYYSEEVDIVELKNQEND